MIKFVLFIIFFFFLMIGLLGFTFLRTVLRFLFGGGKPANNSRGNSNNRNNRQQQQTQKRPATHREKVFSKNDGEYVDYEEVKD